MKPDPICKPGPVKIKAYGLVSLTRNAYLTLQVVLAVAAVVAMIALRPMFAAPGHFLGFINDHFVAIILAMFVLEGAETAVMLVKFKKAEKDRAKN